MHWFGWQGDNADSRTQKKLTFFFRPTSTLFTEYVENSNIGTEGNAPKEMQQGRKPCVQTIACWCSAGQLGNSYGGRFNSGPSFDLRGSSNECNDDTMPYLHPMNCYTGSSILRRTARAPRRLNCKRLLAVLGGDSSRADAALLDFTAQ